MVHVEQRLCRGCAVCIRNAPEGSIEIINNQIMVNADHCDDPKKCIMACPFGAIIA